MDASADFHNDSETTIPDPGPAGVNQPLTVLNSLQAKQQRATVLPRDGGMDGEFKRLVDRGGDGITKPMLLGLRGTGEKMELAPSSDMDEYQLFDLKRMRGLKEQKGQARDLSEVLPLLGKVLNMVQVSSAGSIQSDVASVKGWVKHSENGNLPAPMIHPHHKELWKRESKSTADRPFFSSKRAQAGRDEVMDMEKTFCDNFIVRARKRPGFNGKGRVNSERDTVDDFCKKGLGWTAGANADDCHSKYYLTPNKTRSCEMDLGQKFKVSAADIPLTEIDAVNDLVQSVKEPEWHQELIKDGPNQIRVGCLYEQLKQRHPSARMWTDPKANIAWALSHAAKYITWHDEDNTKDLPGTPHIEKCEQLLIQAGYEIANPTIGVNGIKTKPKEMPGGCSYAVMAYDKVYETMQSPGKSRAKTLDSKVHRLVNPSTAGLKKRFSHQQYQDNGMTRMEITFTGRWTRKDKDIMMDEVVSLLRPALVSMSIHDHLSSMEPFLRCTLGIYAPQVHDMKRKALGSRDKKGRKIDKGWINATPEGLIKHWSNSSTGKSVGRVVSAAVQLQQGSNGFDKFRDCIAAESPCNTPIRILVVVSGLDSFMKGELPVLAMRCIALEKVADSRNDMLMYVTPKVGQKVSKTATTNITAACGVHPQYLSKLALAAAKEEPIHSNTHLDIKFCGAQACNSEDMVRITIPRESFSSLQVLPPEFVTVKVVQDRKGMIGRPSKTNRPFAAFIYQGDSYRFPDQHQEDVWKWLEEQRSKEGSNIRVRYAAGSGFEYALCDGETMVEDIDDGTGYIHGPLKHDWELPVQSQPMKLLRMHRKKKGRGVGYEVDLDGKGRYRVPITPFKAFVDHLKQQGLIDPTIWKGCCIAEGEPLAASLSSTGYYILHTEQMSGAVRGGKGEDEEWIKIVRDDGQGGYVCVLESVPTPSAEQKATDKRRKRDSGEVNAAQRHSKKARTS